MQMTATQTMSVVSRPMVSPEHALSGESALISIIRGGEHAIPRRRAPTAPPTKSQTTLATSLSRIVETCVAPIVGVGSSPLSLV